MWAIVLPIYSPNWQVTLIHGSLHSGESGRDRRKVLCLLVLWHHLSSPMSSKTFFPTHIPYTILLYWHKVKHGWGFKCRDFPAQQSNGLNGDNKIQLQVTAWKTHDLWEGTKHTMLAFLIIWLVFHYPSWLNRSLSIHFLNVNTGTNF